MEEAAAGASAGVGTSDLARLAPGATFGLNKHYRRDFNRRYLLTDVTHRGDGKTYSNQFSCIPSDVQFRPSRITARPSMAGTQTAVVTGPAGEEIHTDEFGRVKVSFRWDRNGAGDDTSSAWLRVSQPSAGAGRGQIWLPRVGDEVVVAFVDGDPDRPIIIGSLYNGDNPPPYALPGGKTRSTMQTASSDGGGASNEIRFDDAAGSEELSLHAARDFVLQVADRHDSTVGGDQNSKIDGDSVTDAGGQMKLSAGSTLELKAGGHFVRVGPNGIELSKPASVAN